MLAAVNHPCSRKCWVSSRDLAGWRGRVRASAVPITTWQDEYASLDDRKDLPPLALPALPASAKDGTLRVVLVRHGQSTWNAEGRLQGSSNTAVLTPKGLQQAQATRAALSGEHFDALWYSPLARAAETAKIVWGDRPWSHAHQDAGLREIDLYSFQGLVKADSKAQYGTQYASWQKKPEDFELDGHAPVRELWHRASLAWGRILTPELPDRGHAGAHGSSGSSTLVVAHNAVNQALLCTALGLPARYFRRLQQRNAAFSVLRLTSPAPPGVPEYGGGDGAGHVAESSHTQDGPLATLECLNQDPGRALRLAKDATASVVLVATVHEEHPRHLLTDMFASLPLGVRCRLLTAPQPEAVALAERVASHLALVGHSRPHDMVQPLADLGDDVHSTAQGVRVSWSAIRDAAASLGRGAVVVVFASPLQVAGVIRHALDVDAGDCAMHDAVFRVDAGALSVLEFSGHPSVTPCALQCANNVTHLQ